MVGKMAEKMTEAQVAEYAQLIAKVLETGNGMFRLNGESVLYMGGSIVLISAMHPISGNSSVGYIMEQTSHGNEFYWCKYWCEDGEEHQIEHRIAPGRITDTHKPPLPHSALAPTEPAVAPKTRYI